jgi:hypothetical protein
VQIPKAAESRRRVRIEAIIAAVGRTAVVGASTLNHVSVVGVAGLEGLGKFVESDPVILISVVTGKEKIALVCSGVNTNGVEPVTQVVNRELPETVLIKDRECIMQVEIALLCEGDFRAFKLVFEADKLAQAIHKLIFVNAVQLARAARNGRANANRRASYGRAVSYGAANAHRTANTNRTAHRPHRTRMPDRGRRRANGTGCLEGAGSAGA